MISVSSRVYFHNYLKTKHCMLLIILRSHCWTVIFTNIRISWADQNDSIWTVITTTLFFQLMVLFFTLLYFAYVGISVLCSVISPVWVYNYLYAQQRWVSHVHWESVICYPVLSTEDIKWNKTKSNYLWFTRWRPVYNIFYILHILTVQIQVAGTAG